MKNSERIIWIVVVIAVTMVGFIVANQSFAQDNRWKVIYENELAKQDKCFREGGSFGYIIAVESCLNKYE